MAFAGAAAYGWPGGRSGEYIVLGGVQAAISSASAPEARLLFTPYWAPRPISITAIAIQILTTAGSTGSVVRIGAYNDDDGIPGSLLFDAGTVDSTTTGTKEILTNQTLPAGRFWLAAAVQGGATTVATLGGINTNGPWNRNAMIATSAGYMDTVYFSVFRSSVTGALPDPAFTARGASVGGTNVGFAFRVRLA